MKYGNTSAGYDVGRICEKDPWWKNPLFPIIPQFEYRKGDDWNANNWNFSWLWLRVWTLEHFAIELSVEVEDTGLNAKAIVGWLRIVVRVLPLPYWWLTWLKRKPALQGNHHGM